MILKLIKVLWAVLVKDFLSGILLTTIKDVAKKFVEKTPWSVILERFLTRSLVMCLKWLTTMSTNTLFLSTVNDFIAVLNGTGLKAAVPIPDKSDGVTYEENNRKSVDDQPNEEIRAGAIRR